MKKLYYQIFLALLAVLILCVGCSNSSEKQLESEASGTVTAESRAEEKTASDDVSAESSEQEEDVIDYINIPYKAESVESFVKKLIETSDVPMEMIWNEDEKAYVYSSTFGMNGTPIYHVGLWVQVPGTAKRKIILCFFEDSYGLSHEVRKIFIETSGEGSESAKKPAITATIEALEKMIFGSSLFAEEWEKSARDTEMYYYSLTKPLEDMKNPDSFSKYGVSLCRCECSFMRLSGVDRIEYYITDKSLY